MSDAPSAPTSSGGAPATSAPSAPASSGASAGASSTPGARPGSTAAPGKSAPTKNPGAIPGTQPETSAPQQTKAEQIAEAKRKYQFKVDGKEWEEELDDVEVRSRLQKSHAADKRMQEAAELRKKFNDAIAYGKDNVAEAVKSLFGMDLDEWAETRLEQRFKEATLSPEQKERAQMEKELAKYRKQEQEARETQERTAKQKYEDEIWQSTEKDFLGALNKMGYSQDTSKFLLPMMASLADAALDADMELDSELLAHETQKHLRTVNQKRLGALKGDNLLSELGPEIVKEVLRAQLSKVKLSEVPEEAPVQAVERKEPVEQRGRRQTPLGKFKHRHLFGE